MAYVFALMFLASFLGVVLLSVFMWGAGKDLSKHDMRIFKLELLVARQVGEIMDLQRKLNELETIKELP